MDTGHSTKRREDENMKQKSAKTLQSPTAADRKRAVAILDGLREAFPEAKTALEYRSPFELLVATILSAQCTDVRVNIVTKDLFKKYTSVESFASADQAGLEKDIHSTGFFRMKAKNIIGCSKALVERFGGQVPSTMEDLVTLPGVGRKTANVLLSESFGKNEGVVVDTHVQRLSQRMGLTSNEDPGAIEEDLMALFPRERWGEVGMAFILHGRKTCAAKKPQCEICEVAKLCPSAFSFEKSAHSKPKKQQKRSTPKKRR